MMSEIFSESQAKIYLPADPRLAQHLVPMATWADRINEERIRRGWSKAELARRAGVSQEAIYKHLPESGPPVDQPRGDTIRRYARVLGLHDYWARTGEGPRIASIPLVGYVGAGEEFFPLADHERGAGHDEVEINMDAVDPIALRVRGRSMIPVYRPGDDLLCSRLRGADIPSAIGRDCVVMTNEGAGYVKQLRRGRNGRFTLRSYNPSFEDLEDIEVDWAAPILIIKRAV